jgi:EAL domain-containing protein (putative c-di-GMP-specific phosphodiesterase class I)
MNQERVSDPIFTFAFQPIVDAQTRDVVSYEALIRGALNESASAVLSKVPADRLYLFDQIARVQAISLATRLGIDCNLNLNFYPLSLYASAESILSTIRAATKNHLPTNHIVLEVVEGEVIGDQGRFADLFNEYRSLGVKVAIDDFGAGYSGLNLLSNFQPDQIKLDMCLIDGIESHGPRQSIVRAILQVCRDLKIEVIAEGVETVGEYAWLVNAGVKLFQGYLFARPSFESFPLVNYPENGGCGLAAKSALQNDCETRIETPRRKNGRSHWAAA